MKLNKWNWGTIQTGMQITCEFSRFIRRKEWILRYYSHEESMKWDLNHIITQIRSKRKGKFQQLFLRTDILLTLAFHRHWNKIHTSASSCVIPSFHTWSKKPYKYEDPDPEIQDRIAIKYLPPWVSSNI